MAADTSREFHSDRRRAARAPSPPGRRAPEASGPRAEGRRPGPKGERKRPDAAVAALAPAPSTAPTPRPTSAQAHDAPPAHTGSVPRRPGCDRLPGRRELPTAAGTRRRRLGFQLRARAAAAVPSGPRDVLLPEQESEFPGGGLPRPRTCPPLPRPRLLHRSSRGAQRRTPGRRPGAPDSPRRRRSLRPRLCHAGRGLRSFAGPPHGSGRVSPSLPHLLLSQAASVLWPVAGRRGRKK